MLHILYNARKFEKHSEFLSFKSLLNAVIEMGKYDEFALKRCSLNYAIIKKTISCINVQNWDITTQIYTNVKRFKQKTLQNYCHLSEFISVL